MDTEEFLTWAAYVTLEPFPEERADAHTAMLMAQQYNMNRGKGKTPKKPKDFYPQWYSPPRAEKTLEEMGHAMGLYYLAMGGNPQKLSN